MPTRIIAIFIFFVVPFLVGLTLAVERHPSAITPQEIPNFHQVDADLYRGGHPRCSGYARLAALGIRTIVDLQGATKGSLRDCEAHRRRRHFSFGIISFRINFLQTAVTGVSSESLRRLFASMERAPKPIFVTCKLGDDRTGLVVALYRMKRREMSFDEAKREALSYDFHPDLLLGLRTTLDRYRNPQEVRLLPPPVDLAEAPRRGVRRPKGRQRRAV
jgi:protein tyrosine/serine phosphatase